MTDKIYHPIVQKLKDWLDGDGNTEAKDALVDSYVWVRDNVDLSGLFPSGIPNQDTAGPKDFEEYLDTLNKFVNWVPSENGGSTRVYNFLCLYYLVIDNSRVRDWQSPIRPGEIAPWTWLSEWIIQYSRETGKWMDTPASLTTESLDTFRKSELYRVGDYIDDGWNTFNDFFARKFKDYPKSRPIASPDDDTIIVNPADSAFDGAWDVSQDADVTFDVKGLPWTIKQLLDDIVDPEGNGYGPQFAGGKFTHSFLGPTDYHRTHAPVAGTVVAAKVIPGLVYLEAVYKPKDPQLASGDDGKPFELLTHRYMRRVDDECIPKELNRGAVSHTQSPLSGDDEPRAALGYQFLQARGLIIIDNPVLGLVAVLPIGMVQVSSVVLSVTKGQQLKKGDEIAYFQLGGSDIVMVFQEKAHVEFDEVEIGTHRNFGERVAKAYPTPDTGPPAPEDLSWFAGIRRSLQWGAAPATSK